MRLTKYQKARLLEFNWNILENGLCDDNTRWSHFDTQDVTDCKILVVATQTSK